VTPAGLTPSLLLLALALGLSGCAKPAHPGDPIAGLTAEQLGRFRRGRAVFDSVFTPQAGLGPLFDARSCNTCHAGGSDFRMVLPKHLKTGDTVRDGSHRRSVNDDDLPLTFEPVCNIFSVKLTGLLVI